jgi:Xaa-Pro aminopeptidase
MTKELDKIGSKLVSLPKNLVDEVWTDRPARRLNPVAHLDEKYSGEYTPLLYLN